MDPLLKRSDAGRVVFLTSGAPSNPRAYRGPLRRPQGRARGDGPHLCRRDASTPIKVNLYDPGPTRTRMRAAVIPGEDPMTLPTAEQVAEKIVPLCLPDFRETGKLYDFPAGKLQSFRPPA